MATSNPRSTAHPTSTHSSSPSPSPFLTLPLELRLQIYTHLVHPATTLTLRSLFIRTNFHNVFMTQHPKDLCTSLFLVCRQVTSEALPLLYAAPTWNCGCRVEALAVQIGARNFGFIRRMGVDVDDLDLVVQVCRDRKQRVVVEGSGFAMQRVRVRVPEALRVVSMPWSSASSSSSASASLLSKASAALDFTNLEVLEVDGYQAAALSSRGTHRVRVEALRLCELAAQLMDFHPGLKTLLQRSGTGDGGADARDLTLGRVKWRFVKDRIGAAVAGNDTPGKDAEHEVDLGLTRSILWYILREEEKAAETSLPIAWNSTGTGRFHLYPFLQTV